MSKCKAVQMSDQMVCVCGNRWDANDAEPPACRPLPQMAHPFHDIHEFHVKYGFQQTTRPSFLDEDKMRVRLNFLLEELVETANAAGYCWQVTLENEDDPDSDLVLQFERDDSVSDTERDLEAFFDGLIDLNYVSYGTAWLMNLPMPEGWNRVHAANMTKIRCERAEDSKRGTTFDVIKPEGFVSPSFTDLLFY